MPKRKPLTEIGKWAPKKATLLWCMDKWPNVDVDKTLELFTRKAKMNGYMYACWDSAFENWVEDPNDFGGRIYKEGLGSPGSREVLLEARELGFRAKHPMETIEQYRTALRQYEPPVQGEMGNLISGMFGSSR